MKVNFKAIGIDDLLGDPGNRNTGTGCRHHDNISTRPTFEVTDISVVRQDFGHSSRFDAVSKINIFGACMMMELVLCIRVMAAIKMLSRAGHRYCTACPEHRIVR